MSRTAAFLGTAAAAVVLDQVTKALVVSRMALGQSIAVIDGFFSLTYIRNTGIAFGLFNDGRGWVKTAVLAGATGAALLFLLWVLADMRRDDRFGGFAAGMVAGGAVGNLIDRLRMGEVVDFLDFYWRSWHWPFFNAADSCITVGVILLLVHQLFLHAPPER